MQTSCKGRIVTGVIGEDVHIMGLRILEHALRNYGFGVYSLGIHNGQDDFIVEAKKNHVHAILISSLCGHAEMLVDGFRARCRESGIGGIILYLGGQLTMYAQEWAEIETTFKTMGFNRVYKPFTLPDSIIRDLESDIHYMMERTSAYPM